MQTQIPQHLKTAQSGIVLIFVIASIILGIPRSANASNITATIQGVVGSGIDQTGVFGAPGNLDGKPFTLVYIIDDTKGRQTFDVSGGFPWKSGIMGSGSDSPATATLTINGRSISFGDFPLNSLSSLGSEVYRSHGDKTSTRFYFDITGMYNLNANNIITDRREWIRIDSRLAVYANYDWRFPFSYTIPTGGLPDCGYNCFNYRYHVYNSNTGQALQNDEVTNTSLIPASITVSGPALSELVSPNNRGLPNKNCPFACEGNPVNVGTGNKIQRETDFILGSNTHLELSRYYNSQDSATLPFGTGWHSTWHRYAAYTMSSSIVNVTREDGRVDAFTQDASGNWRSNSDVTTRLTALLDGSGIQTGWTLVREDDSTETYTLDSHLASITSRAGLVTRLAYDAQNRLATVTGPFGHVLAFAYDANGRIATVTIPDGGVYAYGYDGNSNLISVTYPDHSTRHYLYENTSFPHALTGIVDENGNRYATYTYDNLGRATSTQHAGGAELTTVAYNGDDTVSVTDARGNTHGYTFITQNGIIKPTAVTGTPVQTLGGKSFTYDTSGFVESLTDFNGNTTRYSHDIRGLETIRTEALNSPQTRSVITQWHASFRLPTQITEPGRVTTFSYDSQGNLIQRTLSADGVPNRTWLYAYNANGQVTQVDGPRTDVNDLTTFTYDSQGNLASITDALGHVTRIAAYDANGRPLTIQDPNGLSIQLAYDAQGRLLSRTVGGETTTYSYDAAGQVLKITRPDASYTTFTYDPAHRLTQVSDNLGNKIVYTLDAVGNRIKQQVYDPANTLTRSLTQTFDALDRLQTAVGAQGQTTTLGYDDNGNLTAVTDPLANATARRYDALNRLAADTDPLAGITLFAYNANDDLVQVTDPRSANTAYSYDGLGNLTLLQSPDTGTTTYTYDSAGNRVSATDARGILTTYAYDALNRLVQTQYADGAQANYHYDQGPNGIGRLTSLTDASGQTTWSYDAHGRVIQKQQITGLTTLTVGYAYDAQGRLVKTTYPSGRQVAYAYDTAGRVKAITVDGQTLLGSVGYRPFGPAASWAWGNAVAYARTFDLDGRLTAFPLGQDSRSLTYDAAGRITAVNDATGSQSLDWALLRDSGKIDYSYNGNRLGSRTGLSPLTYAYDAAGNLVGDGFNLYSYDAKGRLSQVLSGGLLTTYSINGLGQRVAKTGGNVINGGDYFAYDEAGHTLGEYDALGNPVQETVWFGGGPVGVVKPGSGLFYVFADQLGTPRVVATPNQKTVWRWVSDPFGNGYPTEGLDDIGALFSYNLRFPGQYYDGETGLHYNYFRDYDPSVGRYVQSDPIGLAGGINLYAYAKKNPIKFIDRLGFAAHIVLLDQYNSRSLLDWANSYLPEQFNTLIVHGSDNGGFAADEGLGKKYSADEVAARLKDDHKYDPSLPTRLVACKSASTGGAEQLANSLGNTVYASPTNITYPVYGDTGAIIFGGEPLTSVTGEPVHWIPFPKNTN